MKYIHIVYFTAFDRASIETWIESSVLTEEEVKTRIAKKTTSSATYHGVQVYESALINEVKCFKKVTE